MKIPATHLEVDQNIVFRGEVVRVSARNDDTSGVNVTIVTTTGRRRVFFCRTSLVQIANREGTKNA